MAIVLKQRKSATETRKADQQVYETVRSIVAEISEKGEQAVRALSMKFDGWNPPSFRLVERQIEEAIAKVPESVIRDILFAQEQVRRFAKHQLSTLKDLEVETLPGVIQTWLTATKSSARTTRFPPGAPPAIPAGCVGNFLKTCTYQKCTPEASALIGDYCARLCEIEGFMGHREQALLRVRRYKI